MTTPDPYTEGVAAEVRAQLGRYRKTARDLAAVLGLSPQTAGRRLNAELPFDVFELAAIAAWLKVDVQALLPDAHPEAVSA